MCDDEATSQMAALLTAILQFGRHADPWQYLHVNAVQVEALQMVKYTPPGLRHQTSTCANVYTLNPAVLAAAFCML